jgi:hypothetical protein
VGCYTPLQLAVTREQCGIDLPLIKEAVEKCFFRVAKGQDRVERFAGLLNQTRGPRGGIFAASMSASVAKAIELARVLNQLPRRLIVYGIEGKTFAAGAGLSSEVEEAAERMLDSVLKELSHMWAEELVAKLSFEQAVTRNHFNFATSS